MVIIQQMRADKLEHVVYSFYNGQHTGVGTGVHLDSYVRGTRANKRERFVVCERWKRLDQRENTVDKSVISADMKQDAVKAFQDQIKYVDG